jgi:cysteine desulfuration protein SufE
MKLPVPSIDRIKDDFLYLDDWEDRYKYVIELGRELPPFDEAYRTDENKVRGCVSQVWLKSFASGEGSDRKISFMGDSDALIVRGLIAIALAIYSNKPAREVTATDAAPLLKELKLFEHLSPQRSNGFAAMITRMRADAQSLLA